MLRKQLAVFLFMSLWLFLADVSAQVNEVSGLIGRTFISSQVIAGSPFSDNRLHFGKGVTFGGNYARHVMNTELLSVSGEVVFVLNADEDWHTHVTPGGDYRSFFVTPGARANLFPDTAVSPWISAGGGFGHFSGNYTVTGSKPTNFGNTAGVFQAGVGLDVRFSGKFSIRAEARDFWSGTPALGVNISNTRQRNLFLAGGLVWHF